MAKKTENKVSYYQPKLTVEAFDKALKSLTLRGKKFNEDIQAAIVFAFYQADVYGNYDKMRELLQALRNGRQYANARIVSAYAKAHGPFKVVLNPSDGTYKVTKDNAGNPFIELKVAFDIWSKADEDKKAYSLEQVEKKFDLVAKYVEDLPKKDRVKFIDHVIDTLATKFADQFKTAQKVEELENAQDTTEETPAEPETVEPTVEQTA
jgi:hypothetical protein